MPAGAHRLGRDGGREVAAAAARLVQGVPSRHRHRVGDQPPERRPVERDFDAWLACSGETSASRPLTRREDTLVEETLYEEARLPVPAHLSLRRRGPHPRRAVPAPSARRHRRWTGGARGVRRVLRHGTVAALAGRIKGSRHGDLWRQFRLLADALSGEPEFESARLRERPTPLGAARARELPLEPRVHARSERCEARQPRLPRGAAPPRLHPAEQGAKADYRVYARSKYFGWR